MRKLASTENGLRKSASAIMLLLLLLPMFWTTSNPNSNPTSTTITSQKAPDETVTVKPITNGDFTSNASGWTFIKSGNNPGDMSGAWTSGGYTGGAVYARLRRASRQAVGDWYQDWSYSGTPQVVSAVLTFRWRCVTYYYAGSNNTVSVLIQPPGGSPTRVWYQAFYSTTSWSTLQSINIKDLITSTGTYRIILRYYGTTGASSSAQVETRWDDVGISITYTITAPPSDLSVVINNNAAYTNNSRVTLSLTASGATYMSFSNSSGGPWTPWEPFATTKQVSLNLTTGDGVKDIYFKANNTGGVSGSVSDNITYDKSAPPAPNLLSPANATATNNLAPQFSWSPVTDATSGLANYTLQYSKDETFLTEVITVSIPAGTTSYTPSSLADGTWFWRVKAIDNAGNVEPYNGTNWFVVIDTVYPPGPALISPPTGSFTKVNSVTFTWNSSQDPIPSSGIASYTLQYSKDSSFVTGVITNSSLTGTSCLVSGLSDGTWYWRVRAIDRAGNQGGYSGSWSVIVDTLPPSSPSLSLPSNDYKTNVNTPLLVWSAATDATSGVANYSLQLDTSPSFDNAAGNRRTITGLTGTNYPVDPALNDGTWYWHVNATDNAGNTGSYSTAYHFLVDTNGPSTPNQVSPSNKSSTSDNTPDFQWNVATDSGSGVASYTLELDTSSTFDTSNRTTITGLTDNYTLTTPLGDDVWYWRVRAVDNVGNDGSWSTNWSLLVDTRVAGAPTLLSPQNGYAISDNTPAFEWTIVDATSYNLYVDNNTDFGSPEISKTGLTVNYTLSEGEALGEGNWYWKVVAVRIGGTNSSTTWGIIIDTVAPSPLTLVSPVDGAQTNINHTLLVWNPATDMTSGIANYILQYSQDPNFVSNVTTVPGWTNTSYRIPNALNDGTWCWRVIAVDRAGNAGSYLGYWNFTVDTQPPTGLTLSSVSGIYTNSLVITLSITASGAQQMYLSNNNVTWVEYNFNASTLWTLTAGDDGVRSVYLRCTDAAGNMAYLPGFYIQVTLDTIPPQPGSPSIPAYGFITSNNKTTFQWIAGSDGSGSGIASYSLQLDTTPTFDSENMRSEPVFTGTNHTLTTALNDGTWYWRVNATDRAGNTGSYSAYFSLIISTIPPAQVTGLQPANDSLLNLVSPQFQWNLVTGAYIYHIQIDRDLNFNTPYLIENLTLSDNEFNPSVDNDKTLTDGTWYWRVEAISIADAHSVYSVVRTLMIDVTPPTNPQPVSPPPSGATKVTYHTPFQWSQVQDAISYWIQLDSTLGFNSGDVITSTDIRGTSCILNNTLSYGVWYWRVVALDSAGNIGDFSTAPTPEFTVDTISPSQPTPRSPVQGYLTNQTTPVLAWYAASDPTFNGVSSGVANYTLWLDNSSSLNSINLRTKTGLNTTSYKVASPLSDGTWYWFVNATDRAGNTGQGSITQSFTIDTAAPAPPLISSMYPNGGSLDISKVTFTWNASSDPSGITGYVIQIDVSDKFDTTNRLEYTVGSGTTFTPDKEFPNGQWYWRIAAIDAAGNLGTWSAPVPFVVNVVGGLSPMMIVIVGGGSSGAAILAVLGYVFYRRAKIPFVIKKIDQSIKLITKGEMPQPVPMRSRTEIVQTIFQDKIAILLKEKIEELEAKKGEKAPEKPEEPTEKEAIEAKPKEAEPKKEVEAKPKAAKAVAPSEAEETDVDMIVKELEKLETKEEMEPSKESEFIRREREELEKPKKKKE